MTKRRKDKPIFGTAQEMKKDTAKFFKKQKRQAGKAGLLFD